MNTPILLTAIFILAAGFNSSQKNDDYKAWIHTEGKSMIKISPRFKNNTNQAVTISYKLQTKKTGAAGNSSSMSQQGQHVIQPNQEAALSVSQINIQSREKLDIKLSVYNNNTLIAQDSLVLNGDN